MTSALSRVYNNKLTLQTPPLNMKVVMRVHALVGLVALLAAEDCSCKHWVGVDALKERT
jgi:hypothetical protein